LVAVLLITRTLSAGEVFKAADGVFFECDIDPSMSAVYSDMVPALYESYKVTVEMTPTTWADLPMLVFCQLVDGDNPSSREQAAGSTSTQSPQSAISALTGLGARQSAEPPSESMDDWVCPEDALIFSVDRSSLEAAGCVERAQLDLSSLALDDPAAFWACDLEGSGHIERYETGNRDEEFYARGCALISGREAQVTRNLLALDREFRDDMGRFYQFSDDDVALLPEEERKRYLREKVFLESRAREEAEQRALIAKLEGERRELIEEYCVKAVVGETLMGGTSDETQQQGPSHNYVRHHVEEQVFDAEWDIFWGAIYACSELTPLQLEYDHRGVPIRSSPIDIEAVGWLEAVSYAHEGKGISEAKVRALLEKWGWKFGRPPSPPRRTNFGTDYYSKKLVFLDREINIDMDGGFTIVE
jgi:hypothetical protein